MKLQIAGKIIDKTLVTSALILTENKSTSNGHNFTGSITATPFQANLSTFLVNLVPCLLYFLMVSMVYKSNQPYFITHSHDNLINHSK